MFTLGYSFRPWLDAKGITDGDSILNYIKDTAAEYNIVDEIRFGHYVCRTAWSSEKALWTVNARQKSGNIVQFTCNFLFMCTGYYDYEKGYTPQWQGVEDFKGKIVHPQHWQPDLDYSDKRVVVIGSGATAVTLVPAMADKAAHVTMLQRSPTYIASRPAEDVLAKRLLRFLPTKLAFRLTRWMIILGGIFTYTLSRRRPQMVKKMLLHGVEEELGTEYDIEKHFTPDYNPWDQRLCLVPDGDLFNAIKSGDVSIVTDHIEQFTENGIQLQSGEHLEADMIVTATGLVVKLMVGVEVLVDGEPINFADTVTYKGIMYSNIPNLASAVGYINASWTLKAELICEYVCRLLKYMDDHNYQQVTPRPDANIQGNVPVLDFSSGYIQRALDSLPTQADQRPWRSYQNYLMDVVNLRWQGLDDDALEFKKRTVTHQIDVKQPDRVAEPVP